MGAASKLAGEYDATMAQVIGVAESCSDEDWGTLCPSEQRTVGVLFDHIATGNPQVETWIGEFLTGRPVVVTPEIINERNAAHARGAASRPRHETIADLKHGSRHTSELLHGLTDEQLRLVQEFGWAGDRDVAWVAGAAFRHPRGHLKSIQEALNR